MDVRYWKCLERHALSGSYEDIIGKAWVSYVENLRKFGIVDGRKIVLYEGLVIDGWQLYRGCIEADIRPDFRELKLPKGMTADEWVETMNDLRRHETQDAAMCRIAERRERIAAARVSGESLRSIAEQEEVSVSTVVDDIEAAGVQGGTPAPPDGKVQGKDGKKQSATKEKILCPDCQKRKHRGVPLLEKCEACKELRKPKKKSLSEQVDAELAEPEKDKPDPTLPEIIAEKNGELESFCRGLMKYVEENMPKDEWLDYMERGAGALQKFKDGCATIRSAKCKEVCPMCKGERCKQCQKTGRVPHYVYQQLVG